MAALTASRMLALLAPYTNGLELPDDLAERLSQYLDLLLLWNAKTNLTAVREPEALVQRQIGESLFAARMIPAAAISLLDFGAGAGFPGIPLQLLRPGMRVTLAESQGKKASFLREAVRVLGVESRVWAGRVEDLLEGGLFDCVAMRAVDHAERMTPVALERVATGGSLLRFYGTKPAAAIEGWSGVTLGLPGSGGWESLTRDSA